MARRFAVLRWSFAQGRSLAPLFALGTLGWLTPGCGIHGARGAASPEPALALTATAQSAPAEVAEPPSSAAQTIVPPPPSACLELAHHSLVPGACGRDQPSTQALLDAALSKPDLSTRDGALAQLESCPTLELGVIRALRAELAAPECADALIDRAAEQDGTAPEIRDALIGLSLAAKLSRLVKEPPKLEPPFDKPRFEGFFKDKLVPWITAQASAIHQLSLLGAKLSGYGKGVAAVEAGLADMRFVEVVREIPLPKELAQDRELSETYYAALDDALNPRKARGRDAALVGLELLAAQGLQRDPRVSRARTLISKLFNGRRIDALDGLLLPALPPQQLDSVAAKLAAALPTFVAGRLLGNAPVGDPIFLRGLLSHGLPLAFQQPLESQPLGPEASYLLSRQKLASGQLFWSAASFAEAKKRAETITALGPLKEPARLVAATARALEKGPANPVDMMQHGPFPKGVGDVAGLDALGSGTGEIAGMAAYNAARILELVPPTEKAKPFWLALEKRYRRAAQLLTIPEQRNEAQERATAAAETAKNAP